MGLLRKRRLQTEDPWFVLGDPLPDPEVTIGEQEIKKLTAAYVADQITIDDLDKSVGAWLKWDTLDPLNKREFEENYYKSLRSSEEERQFPKLNVTGSNPVEGTKVECSCPKCKEMISPNDYTFPDCPKCYINLDGVCE